MRFLQTIQKISPLQIVWIGLFLRICASFFSKGYAFSDDHFEMVELGKAIADGRFPYHPNEVYLFNLLYPITHALVFKWSSLLGWNDPQTQMLLIRLSHAVFNIWMVIAAGKWAKIHYGENGQKMAMWFCAAFWIFPFMSVRSLREFVCIPFILWALYSIEKPQKSALHLFWAGICFAIAFDIRLQTAFIPLGVGLFLIWKRDFKDLILLTISTLLGIACTQGAFDLWYWGDALASVKAYIDYNLHHSGEYPNGPWFQYIGTVLGVCLPISSLFWVWGYLKASKVYTATAWGGLSFFIFHSAFPNKQERFILPFIAIFGILGIVGLLQTDFKGRTQKWFKISTIIFFVLNFVLLLLLTCTYSKRSRVEAMYALYGKQKPSGILISSRSGVPFLPVYYAGHGELKQAQLNTDESIEQQKERLKNLGFKPSHLLIMGENGKSEIEEYYANLGYRLQHLGSYDPGLVDVIAFWLNPKHNINEVWHLYAIK